MTNNKQQSALEWYHQKIVDRQNGNGDSRNIDEIFEQAKAMFQEQIENTYWDGGQDVPMSGKQCTQYYNETFNNNK